MADLGAAAAAAASFCCLSLTENSLIIAKQVLGTAVATPQPQHALQTERLCCVQVLERRG